ncbi:MAG: family 20 glycosylhydrolase [Planctomycetes bacterium]|nr:family 20 glycosylhydrolase [Planctomycetota bacterium]
MIARLALAVVALAAGAEAQLPVVPRPRQVVRGEGAVEIRQLAPEQAALAATSEAFADALRRVGARLQPEAADGQRVAFRLEADVGGPEWYRIAPDERGLVVTASTSEGAARAAATLLQLADVVDGVATVPRVAITDEPALPFRGFMVDMGRNPHGPEVLRQVVDACWFYKVRYLQLHLTDDQLFSWPSRAYPKLHDERSGWTWDAFVALEAYSQARGVTIVPEIDVPAHSTILRQRYPDVFGASPKDLATSASATAGMQTLLTELMEVFAATPYVHIGGDEAYGVAEDDQRDFVNRLARFVKSNGRRAMAWEGPRLGEGEHKVDTDVLHVNWRTVDFPAQQMLDAGYQVVHAAWDPMYIVDHYPRTMFTAVPVERCYGWDPQVFRHVNHGMPTFANPHRTSTADGIVGFLMPWWEGRQQNVFSLCVPRLAAVAAAAWNPDGERDFAGFERRQQRLLRRCAVIAGAELARVPFADPASQRDNLAYRGTVTVSAGASQPVFGPQRLTNGIPDRFDHFLGYPTQPEPLVITIELPRAATVGRVVVHERAVGGSHEVYELLVSVDGSAWQRVGAAGEGSRGEQRFVEHRFEPREVRYLRIDTRGCHGLTFPSFSRLSEVQAYAQ